MSKKARIVVRRQRGPGFWATIHRPGQRTEAVQSGRTYGFETREEAKAEAEKRLREILKEL